MIWKPIDTAPKDKTVLVFIPKAAAGLEIELAHCASDDPDNDWYPSTHPGCVPPLDVAPAFWAEIPPVPES